MPEPDTDFERARQCFVDGLACFEAGRHEDAERLFEASLAALPGRVSTLVNLAAARLALGRPQAALDIAERLVAAEPGNLDAWFHRATALSRLGRREPALAACEHALALDDRQAAVWLLHGQTQQQMGRHAQALASYDRALAIDPGLAQAWTSRGGILRETQRVEEAAHAFEQALAHGGDPELNRYYLASVRGHTLPAAAPPSYVQALFDDYADEFDTHVVRVLGYRAHEALIGRLPPGRRFASALDLGCGTGLCGPLLAPIAAHITGVDLSSGMLDKARARGVYRRLAQADLLDHLRATDDRHDLVVAADVFIYVGDLAPVFDAVHRVMDAGGTFCFTAEAAGAGVAEFALLPSLRYAHSERHLRELAVRSNFEVEQVVREPVREEQRRAIDGLFVYLRRR